MGKKVREYGLKNLEELARADGFFLVHCDYCHCPSVVNAMSLDREAKGHQPLEHFVLNCIKCGKATDKTIACLIAYASVLDGIFQRELPL
jgi:hypothetical protein